MAKKNFLFLFTLYVFAAVMTLSVISDANQETRFSKNLAATVKIGKTVQLTSQKDEFLAIYTEATSPKSRGGIILLHDIGSHANWPEIIAPLRRELPEKGWNTLSVQLPILPNSTAPKQFDEIYVKINRRIKAAIEYYRENGIYNLVLIGHSFGASAGKQFINTEKEQSKGVIAFVGISMYEGVSPSSKGQGKKPQLAMDNIPILDIHGSMDLDKVLNSAKDRASIAKKTGAENFTQIAVTGADHLFSGLNHNLISRINTWLIKQAPSVEIEIKKDRLASADP